jgi:transposase
MLSQGKTMEIAELYDLTHSYATTAQLAGVDPKTVKRALARRAAGYPPETRERGSKAGPYVDKIDEWIERSSGLVRADVVHEKLTAMGYAGSERTTRRVVAELKHRFHKMTHRIYKPWITEPGLWLQYDFANGPAVAAERTTLFVAWLAWCRFRVVFPIQDRSLPEVIGALDATFRLIGGVPTYVLTDNEKTVTTEHIANVAVRNQTMAAAALYYGFTLATCVPYDPESKGGAERAVGVAKADLVPTQANLAEEYRSHEELRAACVEFCAKVNGRVHSVTRAVPAERLETERASLHQVPTEPYREAFGLIRGVSWSATVSWHGARYSVPQRLAGEKVWVRESAGEIIITHREGSACLEVARHQALPAGGASIKDEHYEARPSSPGSRPPRATSASEAAFLALGTGAAGWLMEAAGAGVTKMRHKMQEAVDLAKVYGADKVDAALGEAAILGRFAAADLLSILQSPPPPHMGSTAPATLQSGTGAWEGFGS